MVCLACRYLHKKCEKGGYMGDRYFSCCDGWDIDRLRNEVRSTMKWFFLLTLF